MRRRTILIFLSALLLLASPAWAARQTNGTTQFLNSAGAVDLSSCNKVSISFWLWQDAFVTGFVMALEHGSTGVEAGGLTIDPNWSDGTFVGLTADARLQQSAGCFTRPSAAAWHHFDGTLPMFTDQLASAYVDGVLS